MRVIVVGGGFAGVSAAVALAKSGCSVELHEKHSALGGRAHHVPPPPGFPVPLDNGPHLFSGAYRETFDLLEILGRSDAFHWMSPLRLRWLLQGDEDVSLHAAPLPSPLHLAWGLLFTDAFPVRSKIDLTRDLLALRSMETRGWTVQRFLEDRKTDAITRRRFWEPLTRAVVNMQPSQAPLEGLAAPVRRMFFGRAKDSAFAVAKVPLGEIFGDSVGRFLEQHHGRVCFRSTIENIRVQDGRVQDAQTTDGEKLRADAWVLAVLPVQLAQLLPEEPWADLSGALGASPIVSAHLHLDRPVFQGHFACLEGARFEWVFNRNLNWGLPLRGQILSFVASADPDLARSNVKDLSALALKELIERVPAAAEARILGERVTKEMSATIAWTPANTAKRPGARTPLANLALAGDWTDTGLPATIEGAVVSGRLAAETLLERRKS